MKINWPAVVFHIVLLAALLGESRFGLPLIFLTIFIRRGINEKQWLSFLSPLFWGVTLAGLYGFDLYQGVLLLTVLQFVVSWPNGGGKRLFWALLGGFFYLNWLVGLAWNLNNIIYHFIVFALIVMVFLWQAFRRISHRELRLSLRLPKPFN